MVRHLVQLSLINDSQRGFMPKRSCLTNLLEFLEYVTDAVDNGKPVDVIYLDFYTENFISNLHNTVILFLCDFCC